MRVILSEMEDHEDNNRPRFTIDDYGKDAYVSNEHATRTPVSSNPLSDLLAGFVIMAIAAAILDQD